MTRNQWLKKHRLRWARLAEGGWRLERYASRTTFEVVAVVSRRSAAYAWGMYALPHSARFCVTSMPCGEASTVISAKRAVEAFYFTCRRLSEET